EVDVTTDPATRARHARFEAIFEESYEALLAYARRRVGADADDIVADTFTVTWRRLEDVPLDPLPWMYGVARKVISEERRAARRREALLRRVADASPREEADSQHSNAVLLALSRLGERDREAVLLVAWEGLTAEQAASAMGCTAIAFRVRLHRARMRLRRQLESLDALSFATAAVVAEEVKNT
ncbi:MAG: RNA polymerase sigma factor, partial [Gemmatimonadota bacterium]